MFKKIVIFFFTAFLSHAFAQNQIFTMKVEDRINRVTTYERHEFNSAAGTWYIYDTATNSWISTVSEFKDGRGAVMMSPFGGSVVQVQRPLKDLKSGQETSGTLKLAQFGAPPLDLMMSVKATRVADLTVLESIAAGPGYVNVNRVAFLVDPSRATWIENITHINGKKVMHTYVTPMK